MMVFRRAAKTKNGHIAIYKDQNVEETACDEGKGLGRGREVEDF
jgi:hypothetical protein